MVKVTKDKCPICTNNDPEKISLFKERENILLYKCNVCLFKWGVEKKEE